VIVVSHESDDRPFLDYNGERAFHLFRLANLGRPILRSLNSGRASHLDRRRDR
jgi:hypothetical protein